MSENFLERVREWHDRDVAEYHLAVCLGVLPLGTPFATDAKHVFWSNNVLGNALNDVVQTLIDIGALEHDGDQKRVRHNPSFEWSKVSSLRSPT